MEIVKHSDLSEYRVKHVKDSKAAEIESGLAEISKQEGDIIKLAKSRHIKLILGASTQEIDNEIYKALNVMKFETRRNLHLQKVWNNNLQ